MDIDAFILVGGRSSRMGRDKASLELAGVTLVERAAATIMKALGPTRITLVAAGPEQVRTIFGHDDSLPFVFDVHPTRGPFGAVHSALANAGTEWIFVMACDLPRVTPDFIRALSQHAADDIDAVAPIQHDGKPQPLCAYYRVVPCLAAAEKTLASNRPTPAAKYLLDQVKAKLVTVAHPSGGADTADVLLNVNTPEDFRELFELEQLRTGRPT